jgi:hypothetical protein
MYALVPVAGLPERPELAALVTVVNAAIARPDTAIARHALPDADRPMRLSSVEWV